MKKHRKEHRRRGEQQFLTTLPAGTSTRREARSWPIVRAYIPLQEAWHSTGHGTAGIVRQQPNGKLALAQFGLSLMHDGLENMHGKDDTSLEEIEEMNRSRVGRAGGGPSRA